MKTLFTLSSLALAALSSAFGFADITEWSGSGSNQTALVIDWNDGVQPESLVFGFRWSGSATGFDMLNSIMTSDPRLSRVEGGGGPQTIFGLGWDQAGDGLHLTGSGEDAHAIDRGDHYAAGWFTSGFWGYYVADGTSLPSSWSFGSSSLLTTTLATDTWNGLSFAPAFNDSEPSAPSNPVPEPFSCAALALGFACMLRRRR